MTAELNICHLYPDLLNLYGDRGNVMAIRKRCEWMGIRTSVFPVSIGDPFDAEKYDIVFIGGGQDYEQKILQPDLLDQKGTEIKSFIQNGGVLLAICGGYQLLGDYYQTQDGEKLKFLGALDFVTFGGKKRMIGNFMFQCDFLKSGCCDGILVGFENHSGKTFLGNGVKPLGRVVKGYGNNGTDHTEGAVYKNTFCSYGHGSLLPKNPAFSDYLIRAALQRKYGRTDSTAPLDDSLENLAHFAACRRCSLLRRPFGGV